MTGWLPRVTFPGFCMSDGRGEDAEGWSISVEWRGVIVELAIGRRQRPVRQCIVCDRRSRDARPIVLDAPYGPLDLAMCRSCLALAGEVLE